MWNYMCIRWLINWSDSTKNARCYNKIYASLFIATTVHTNLFPKYIYIFFNLNSWGYWLIYSRGLKKGGEVRKGGEVGVAARRKLESARFEFIPLQKYEWGTAYSEVVRLSPAILLFTAPWRHTLIKMDVRRVLHNFIFFLPTFFVYFFILLYAHSPSTQTGPLFSLPYSVVSPCSHLVFYCASVFGTRMESNRPELRSYVSSVSPCVLQQISLIKN